MKNITLALVLFLALCAQAFAWGGNGYDMTNSVYIPPLGGGNMNVIGREGIGIGTAAPSSALQVNGTVTATTASLATPLGVSSGGTGSITGSSYNLTGLPIVTSNAYHPEGDSITAGTGPTSSAFWYVNLIGADIGATVTNNAISGAQACDMADLQTFKYENPAETHNPIYSVMIGGNDATYGGVGAYEVNYHLCHQSALTWLTVPSTNKVFAQSTGCTKTGTWTADNTYQTGIAEQSTTNGSTMACAIQTYGEPIYVWYRIKDTFTGSFNYNVDGGSNTSVNTFTVTPINTVNNDNQSVGYIRIPSVAAGSHVVNITVTSATGATAVVSPLGVGTPPPYPTWGTPEVFDGSVMTFQTGDSAFAANVQYNLDANADISLLQGDGLKVYKVGVNNFQLATNSALWAGAGNHHPSNAGSAQIQAAFEGVMQYTPQAQGMPQSAIAGVNYYTTNPTSLAPTYSATAPVLTPGITFYNNTGSNYNNGEDIGQLSNGNFANRYFSDGWWAWGTLNGTSGVFGVADVMLPNGTLGIGEGQNAALNFTPLSGISLSGNISVGSAYQTVAAPSNGAAIQGQLLVGTQTALAGAYEVFASHLGFTTGFGAPVVSACGGGTLVTGSSDNKWTVSGITAATACTITWGSAMPAAPVCTFNTSTGIPVGGIPTTSAVTTTMAAFTGTLQAICF